MTSPALTPPTRPTPGRGPWRRLAVPIGAWALLGLVLAFVHRWVPGSSWLLVHTVTLGIVTNAIVVFTDHFAGALLKSRSGGSDLPRRLAALNLGSGLAALGMWRAWPGLTVAGATVVACVIAWHGWALARQVRRSLSRRFAGLLGYYVVACGWLVLGALFGSLLAFVPREPAYGRLLAAHQAANLMGFVGLTVVATWVTFWPMALRTKIVDGTEPAARRGLAVMVGGVAVVVLGALVGQPLLAGLGALAVTSAYGWLTVVYARVGLAKPPVEVSPIALAAAWLWGLAGLAWFTLDQLRGLTTAAALQEITPVWVVGFGLQMVLGALSYLFPMLRGGGPAAARQGHRVMNHAGGLRLVAYNLGLLLFLLARTSWVLVVASMLVFAALLWFLVLAVVVAVRRPPAPPASVTHPEGPVDRRPTAMGRRDVLGAALGTGAILGLGALEAATRLRGGGQVSTEGAQVIDVTAADMRFTPSTLTAPAGAHVVLRVTNADTHQMTHDLALSTGQQTPRLAPGESALLDVGTVTAPVDGWCTIIGHQQMGMTLRLSPGDAMPAEHQHAAGAAALTRRTADLSQPPGADHVTRDAALPAVTAGQLRLDLECRDAVLELAPGMTQRAMTYNGLMLGPVIRASVGQRVLAHLTNSGDMGHSLDFHAGTVSPDDVMRTIQPGESLDYAFTAHRAGIWLYHCSTAPMSTHIAAGMLGAVVVPPAGLAPVDHEWVLVQHEAYLAAANDQPVNADKIVEGRHDLMLFNGHANQYVHAPLQARAGERIRLWVLAGGPNHGISFHVVGAQFDTVYKEGAYLLRPGTDGGAQALDLAPAQGGFVEMTLAEPGRYTFVNHSMVEAERGARGFIDVV